MKASSDYIVNMLINDGYEVYLVGGAVRDLLLGRPSNDDDLVTSAQPDQIVELFKDRKVKTVGKSFGVVLVDDIEVATFRSDSYGGLNDKNVVITYADSIENDLMRRDLTINAMAYNYTTGQIIDLFGGQKDLKNRVIKFVGNPENRIHEDPNRILRACRFYAYIDGIFDKSTLHALQKKSHLVDTHVAKERIRLELLKAMTTQNPSLFFHTLKLIGALPYVILSLNDCVDAPGGHYHAETVYMHSLLCGDALSPKNKLLRLTGYLHDIGKPHVVTTDIETDELSFHGHEKEGEKLAKMELNRLRFSFNEVDYITLLIRLHMRIMGKKTSPKAIRRTLRRCSEYNIDWKDLLRLRLADRRGNMKGRNYTFSEIRDIVEKFKTEIDRAPESDYSNLALNGKDIMDLTGMKPGPEVGRILRVILDIVTDEPQMNTPELLKALVEKGEL